MQIIFKELKELLKNLTRRYLKAKVVDGFVSARSLQTLDVGEKVNQLDGKMEVGAKAERLLKRSFWAE